MSKERLSRRDFGRLAFGLAITAVLGCKEDKIRPKPRPFTQLATESPIPYPSLPTTTPEVRNINIPGIEVSTRKVSFRDITSVLQDVHTADLRTRLLRRELPRHNNESTAFFGELFFKNGPQIQEKVYYSMQDGRLFAGFGLAGRDEELFHWPGIAVSAGSRINLSRHGKVAYEVFEDLQGRRNMTIGEYARAHEARENIKPFQNGTVIADIPNSTKTIIKNTLPGRLGFKLSYSGNVLVLHPWSADYRYSSATQPSAEVKEPLDGTYVINLDDWSMLARFQEPLSQVEISEAGNLLYTSKGGGSSEIINIKTGERKTISWHSTLSRYDEDDTVSPNFEYIATKIAMFFSSKAEEGQWGMMVKTPKGTFPVNSPHRSFVPHEITNDGTIYASGFTLKPDPDGEYREAVAKDGTTIKTE